MTEPQTVQLEGVVAFRAPPPTLAQVVEQLVAVLRDFLANGGSSVKITCGTLVKLPDGTYEVTGDGVRGASIEVYGLLPDNAVITCRASDAGPAIESESFSAEAKNGHNMSFHDLPGAPAFLTLRGGVNPPTEETP